MIELLSCPPPPQIIVVESDQADEIGLLDGAIDFLLEPLHPLREQFLAITGFGLELLPEDAEGVLRRTRIDGVTGVSLSYLAIGDPRGTPIVFLHGSPGVAEEWGSFLIDVPSGQYRMAPDRPGFGETLPPEPVASLSDQASAIRPLIGSGDDPRAIVVGYSYSGPVALRLAADYPDRVAALLLIGSAADPAEEEIHPLQDIAALDIFAQLLPQELASSNAELLALRDDLEGLAQDLGQITASVTIIQGLLDTLVPPQSAFYLQEKLQGSAEPRMILIEDGDHFLPWSHAELLKQALNCVIEDATRQKDAQP